jgi:phage gpG-like protein
MIQITKIRDEVTSQIDNIINTFSTANSKILLETIGNEFLRRTLNNFGGNGQDKEKEWPPLSKAYAKKVKRSKATLYDTGALKDSIKLQIRPEFALVYTRNKYAAAQAFGYKRNNLPPRNFWPMQTYGTPNYSRLVFSADFAVYHALQRKLNILSHNSLPLILQHPPRSKPVYGNIFNLNT